MSDLDLNLEDLDLVTETTDLPQQSLPDTDSDDMLLGTDAQPNESTVSNEKVRKIARKNDEKVIVQNNEPSKRQIFGKVDSTSKELVLPSLHDNLSREAMLHLFKEHLDNFEYTPTGNKTPTISKGQLSPTSDIAANGLLVCFDEFFKKMVTNYQLRFGGLYFRHTPTNGRAFPLVIKNEDGTSYRVKTAAHYNINTSISFDELSSGEALRFRFSNEEFLSSGKMVFEDPNAESILTNRQNEIDAVIEVKKTKASKNLKNK